MKHKISFLLFVSVLTFISCNKSSNPVSPYTGKVVLVSGTEYINGHNIAKYWINGTPVNLTDTTKGAFAQSIFMTGNDLYVAGDLYNGNNYAGVYWKNGSAVNLTDGKTYVQATFIFIGQ
jgi:hypothetical protein